MAQFLVRQCCEHSKLITANSEEEAIKDAEEIPSEQWEQSWSEIEAEPYTGVSA